MALTNSEDLADGISSDEYLEKHHVLMYVEDAIGQLLEYKDENAKVISSKFLGDYFRSVHQGAHILFRDYDFIQATPYNRSCFIKCVWNCFRHIANHGELLSIKEYHSLLCLLCHDFPLDMVQRTARIVLMDDALDCLISFTDFLYAFQIQFYYEDYINACKEPYDNLLSGVTVFVPSTDNWQQSQPSNLQTDHDSKHNEGVNSQSLYDAMEKTCLKLSSNTPRPSLQHLHDELCKPPRITFYSLLMAMSKNDDINNEIGFLPNRDSVLEGNDADIIIRH
ncbi:centriolar satellite-associated tubulin polyglutamylase complex regulator 1-like [Clavelina lepadiformis]|uniref:Centriolar satellite-associated tubulin polyglutamylase complex regulator 1 n=1 Tax=Clavelina lepadiformis TaxID=159417 RepID=A0ABP0FIT2_CLALP